MKIYHTETQADYDALMIELERLGIETLEKRLWKENDNQTVVLVRAIGRYIDNRTDTTFGGLARTLKNYPRVPIIKYKAKADKKMKFTKENVYKLIIEYRKDSNYSLNDLQDKILNLDDATEKIVVPKFVAEFYEKCENATLLFLITQLEATNSRSELGKWYRSCSGRHRNGRANAQKVIAKMTLYGYTIEKEPQYIVSIMDLGIDRIILMKNRLGYSFELESENDGHWEVHFTEQQIKEYDKRYWAFAIPVEGKK